MKTFVGLFFPIYFLAVLYFEIRRGGPMPMSSRRAWAWFGPYFAALVLVSAWPR